MAKIVLLSCTKSKLDKPAAAQDLYSASPMFQKTLEYGKELKPDKMFILSAKHHLVPLSKKLAPYDKTLKEMSKDEKEKWAEEVYKQMKQNGIKPEKDTFIMLTGSEYMKPLLKYIPEDHIETPMEGKRFGERLKWLNSQVQKIKEVLKRVKNIIYETIQTTVKRVY
jgi:basic membrane lipoprotein Med (substrate-binding protein (PBP1-ABC) superfamily)